MQHTRKTLAATLNGNPSEPKPKVERDYAAEDGSRTTEQLKLRVRKEVLGFMDEAASKANLTKSEYITALVLGQDTTPTPAWERASDNILLTLTGHKVMQAIALVTARIEAGEEASATLAELQTIRRQIVQGQLTLRPDYEKYLDARSENGDNWAADGKK